MNLIHSSEAWWVNLPRFRLGWDILKVVKRLGFHIVILTQRPRRNSVAYSGKKKWIDANLGEDIDVILTRDKGLVYGRVLVDDFPPSLMLLLRTRLPEIIFGSRFWCRFTSVDSYNYGSGQPMYI